MFFATLDYQFLMLKSFFLLNYSLNTLFTKTTTQSDKQKVFKFYQTGTIELKYVPLKLHEYYHSEFFDRHSSCHTERVKPYKGIFFKIKIP